MRVRHRVREQHGPSDPVGCGECGWRHDGVRLPLGLCVLEREPRAVAERSRSDAERVRCADAFRVAHCFVERLSSRHDLRVDERVAERFAHGVWRGEQLAEDESVADALRLGLGEPRCERHGARADPQCDGIFHGRVCERSGERDVFDGSERERANEDSPRFALDVAISLFIRVLLPRRDSERVWCGVRVSALDSVGDRKRDAVCKQVALDGAEHECVGNDVAEREYVELRLNFAQQVKGPEYQRKRIELLLCNPVCERRELAVFDGLLYALPERECECRVSECANDADGERVELSVCHRFGVRLFDGVGRGERGCRCVENLRVQSVAPLRRRLRERAPDGVTPFVGVCVCFVEHLRYAVRPCDADPDAALVYVRERVDFVVRICARVWHRARRDQRRQPRARDDHTDSVHEYVCECVRDGERSVGRDYVGPQDADVDRVDPRYCVNISERPCDTFRKRVNRGKRQSQRAGEHERDALRGSQRDGDDVQQRQRISFRERRA
jgi:hypothetical protein